MATPTPSNPAQPSSASKKPTGHVTTPSHLGLSSPAPRSVPSPAATRKEHAGKTPINHPTASSSGSKTLGSTPMVPNLSQTGMTVSSSPGGHNVSFGTPSAQAGLGVDLGSGTPGQMMNMSTPLVGGASMMPTMSEMGLGTGGGKRNEEEERRAKMRRVLKSIGRPKGRLSEENIIRLSRRMGLEVAIDEKRNQFSAAGKRVVVDVYVKDGVLLQNVEAIIMGADDNDLKEQSIPASKLLTEDLAMPNSIPLLSNLDRYAASLHRLARVDKLIGESGVQCFSAFSGVYKCLQRLYKLELAAAKEKLSKGSGADEQAEREVLCKGSGRVSFHENKKMGLALGYWTMNNTALEGQKDDSAMDIDGNEEAVLPIDETDDTHYLRIEAEACSAAMYPSIRVSDNWLPEEFELQPPESGEIIPWLDPPPTYVNDSATGQGDIMVMDAGQRLPDVRFVAKLDPPVVMPYQIALSILSAVGVQQAPQIFMMTQYQALLLDAAALAVQAGEPITADQSVLALRNDQEVDVTHHYILDVAKPELGFKLDEIPFSHPRQLVQLLPILRQWAHLGSLLQTALKTAPSSISDATNGTNGIHSKGHIDDQDVSLDSLLNSENQADLSTELRVNIGLATSPQPTLSIMYEDPSGANVSNIDVGITLNAGVVVTSCEGMKSNSRDTQMEASQSEEAKNLAKALAFSGDLGVWIEWMRNRA